MFRLTRCRFIVGYALGDDGMLFRGELVNLDEDDARSTARQLADHFAVLDAEDERYYPATGQVLDLDHLLIHGREGTDCPFSCRYYGDSLSEEGVAPTEFEHQ